MTDVVAVATVEVVRSVEMTTEVVREPVPVEVDLTKEIVLEGKIERVLLSEVEL